jgi:hypothetical protein
MGGPVTNGNKITDYLSDKESGLRCLPYCLQKGCPSFSVTPFS